MTIEIVGPADGEILRVGPMTIRVLEEGSKTHRRLGMVEVTLPPRLDGPPQHVHRNHDESFFVLSGTATFTSGDDTVEAQPGMFITAPPGTPHTFANRGGVPVVMLCTLTPDLYINYFREVAAVPPEAWNPKAIGEIMSRYATEVVPHR